MGSAADVETTTRQAGAASRERDLKGPYWIVIGAVVGFLAGLMFGIPYAVAGVGIGMAGGIAIYLAMR